MPGPFLQYVVNNSQFMMAMSCSPGRSCEDHTVMCVLQRRMTSADHFKPSQALLPSSQRSIHSQDRFESAKMNTAR